MLGAVAVGFVASRFLKASESADHRYPMEGGSDDGYGRGAYGPGSYAQGAYGQAGYRDRGAAYGGTVDTYRSPVASPANPRDPVAPTPRAPMDSTSTAASASTAGTSTAPDTSLPRVNRPVNDLGAGASGHANAGTAPRNSNEGDK